MKKVEALLKPYLIENLRKTLPEAGINGMTVTEVQIWKFHLQRKNGKSYDCDKEPRVIIEIVVDDDEEVDTVIGVIRSATRQLTNPIDVYAYVSKIEDSTRIRTGQTGEESLR